MAREMLEDACEGRRFDRATDSIKEQDIPTDKRGLLVWLNTNLDTDNG